MKLRMLPLMLLATLSITSVSSGCKKAIQNAQEDALMRLITNNIWLVTSYKEGNEDMTALFAPYEFKFNKDKSVLGKKAGAPDAVGSWVGSAETMSITSAFPNGPEPLTKLTGVWQVTKSTLTTVNSTREANGKIYYLNLKSK
jgi:hypothetical protein